MATKAQVNEFIKKVGAAALKEAQERRAAGKKWILPGICVAQGAQESGWGTSQKMINANALFGIKVGNSKYHFGDAWKDKAYSTKTKECYDGKTYVGITDMFRAYDSIQDAITDYMDLLCVASRYKSAANNTDPRSTITAIKNGGYATDPNYINKIMSIYNTYPDIAALDVEFLGKSVVTNTTPASAKPTFTVGKTYTLQDNMYVRITANGNKKPYSSLTDDAKKHGYDDGKGFGILRKGTKVTCKGVTNKNGAVWIQIPSGWVCAVSANGKQYVK